MKKQITVTIPSIDEVEFTVECLPEHIPIEGNAIASGDADFDEKVNNDIQEQLENGNEWAWCTIRVIASWNDLEGDDYLGGCSYKSKKDFISEGGYYDDMRERAYDELVSKIESLQD